MLRIRFERIRRGWTQRQLSRLARVTQSDISLIEIGRLLPTQDELGRLALALDVATPADLLRDVVAVEPGPTQPPAHRPQPRTDIRVRHLQGYRTIPRPEDL